jgi:hypothetical protein
MSETGKMFSRKTSIAVSFLVLVLILLAGAIPVVLFVRSTAVSSTVTFTPAINLSNDGNKAEEPTVSSNGQNVYVAWTEGSKGIFFRESTNGGSSWTPPTTSSALKLSPKGGVAEFPIMFTEYQQVTSGDVYVAWAQSVTQANGSKILQIFVAASTNNGESFTVTQLSHNSTNDQNTPAIAAYGSDVYVAWFSAKLSYSSPGAIYVASSTNSGGTWSSPTDIYPLSTNGEAEIVADGAVVYVMMDQSNFVYSTNSGASWSAYTALYNYTEISGSVNYAREPWVAGWGALVYTTWEANSTSGAGYQDYGRVSDNGGQTWGPLQTISGSVKDAWEPENVAYGSNVFTTFHSLGNQGVYMTSVTGVTTEDPTWSTPVEVNSGMKGTSSYGHVATSDGVNVFVLWGQEISSGSATWDAYVAYSGNSGASWSAPINISNNSNGVAAGNQDVTLFALSSNGASCFAAWTYTSGSTSQIYFASS